MLDTNRKYTSDEFLALSELEGRYELLSGDIYAMAPSPSEVHQNIAGAVYSEIRNYIRKNNGSCKVFIAPFDVKLDDYNTVQPDVFVVCDKDKPDGKKCDGAPDWVIEILSPSNAEHDTVEKLILYSKCGVKEYWIVDPTNEKVLVYPFAEKKITGMFTFDDNIEVGIYRDNDPPLSIKIRDIL